MEKLLWVDLEMTGLNEQTDHILEVAVMVTDLQLNVCDQLHAIVYQPPHHLLMDPVVKKLHEKSGLLSKISTGKPLSEVEADFLLFMNQHFPADQKVILCGNSVGNDKRFIDYYFPKIAERLHYRIIDVSSFKEIFQRRYQKYFTKQNTHQALIDIQESIEELKFYLSFVSLP